MTLALWVMGLYVLATGRVVWRGSTGVVQGQPARELGLILIGLGVLPFALGALGAEAIFFLQAIGLLLVVMWGMG